jgi:hypothetical protein
MKKPIYLKKRVLISLGALLLPGMICCGQTNSVPASAPSHQPPNVYWEGAAKAYYLSAHTDISSQSREAKNSTAKNKPSGGVAPQAKPRGHGQMNAETESAQYQRMEEEGLMQTRQAMREEQHNLTLQTEMGVLCHDPEALCLGESIAYTRILGSGTASGVP